MQKANLQFNFKDFLNSLVATLGEDEAYEIVNEAVCHFVESKLDKDMVSLDYKYEDVEAKVNLEVMYLETKAS